MSYYYNADMDDVRQAMFSCTCNPCNIQRKKVYDIWDLLDIQHVWENEI